MQYKESEFRGDVLKLNLHNFIVELFNTILLSSLISSLHFLEGIRHLIFVLGSVENTHVIATLINPKMLGLSCNI